MSESLPYRSGLVAVVGRPNVGKSTLLNRLLGQKLLITSPRPQTTRNRITAVLTRPDAQLVFMDTPGLHREKDELHRFMMREIQTALAGVDVALAVLDGAAGIGPGDAMLLSRLAEAGAPTVVAVNKIDRLTPPQLLEQLARLSHDAFWHSAFPISAESGEGVDDLLATLIELLPHGPPLYPEETLTDRSERFVVSELIREQVFRQTYEEIPHAVAVRMDAFHESQRPIRIEATVLCEQESQKGIIIGKGGQRLKEIGTLARQEIEALLGAPVVLKLYVKVSKDWRKKRAVLEELGLF